MVAALFGCLLRRGGARAAEAGRVISVGRVSVPESAACRVPRGGPSSPHPLPGVPRQSPAGAAGVGEASVPVVVRCARARFCLRVSLGVWLYACVGVLCVGVSCPCVGECVGLSARLFSVCLLCVFSACV